MKDEISPQQILGDHELVKFLVTKRPIEVGRVMAVNDIVIERVKKSFQNDPDRATGSMSYEIFQSDNRITECKRQLDE
jgi:hypothetical protein